MTKGKSQIEQRNNMKAKDKEQDIQIQKMQRYPPSLNGINKNLP
ncbi:hypothetical protein [Cohnella lupini]|uniref:Uncharacterized protein n=1 Tax=Cohnella lupini TaxID=1294267 RepID=A0A3D9IEP8_9BACL|nr:hypothetical protein [Cohnella lupini]RED60264.1 hypothetical protein DFP95_10653 [Cohnella lupini]